MTAAVCPVCSDPITREDGMCSLCMTLDRQSGSTTTTTPESLGEGADANANSAMPEPTGPGAEAEPVVSIPSRLEEKPPAQDRTIDDSGGDLSETARFFRQLASIKERKLFAILFLGFREAGKTWLLHRIKQRLFEEESTPSDPPFQRVKAARGRAAELPATSKIEFHTVLSAPSYVLIDIPGEMTKDLINARYDELRMLLAAMVYSKAIVVALPADLMAFGPLMPDDDSGILAAAGGATLSEAEQDGIRAWAEDFRDGANNIDDFAHGLFRVAGIRSYLEHHDIDPADEAKYARVTHDAVVEHMSRPGDVRPVGGEDGVDCPTFFALTKADRILPLFCDHHDPIMTTLNIDILARPQTKVFQWLAKRAGYFKTGSLPLDDPWQAVRNVRTSLHTQIINFFPMAKFDFATAFYGHDGKLTLTSDHYGKHPQHGVYEVLQWISRARRLGRRPRALRLHYALAARARRSIAGIRKRKAISFWRPSDA